MKRLQAGNAATIRVTYPDDCRHQWKLLKESQEAKDVLKFAAWLQRIAEDIVKDSATREEAHVSQVAEAAAVAPKRHARSCPAYGNYQPPYEPCDCGYEETCNA